MKIVLTVHQFLPDFSAGTEILTFEAAKELKKRGHDIIVWTAYPTAAKNFVDEYEYQDIPVKRYNFNADEAAARSFNRLESDYRNTQFEKIFERFLVEFRPDIIHFFHLSRLSATAIDAGWKIKIPLVFTATDFWMICPTSQLRIPDSSLCLGPDQTGLNCLRHLVEISQPPAISFFFKIMPDWMICILVWGMGQKWWPEKKYASLVISLQTRRPYLKDAMNKLDKVLVPTRLMNDMLVDHGLEKRRIEIQSYGINLQFPENLQVKQNKRILRLGFIGTLNEHKGVHILLKALNQLDKEIPLELKIYGKQDEFPDYVLRLKKLAGSDRRIKFCGTFPNNEIGKVFARIDVLVVPSIWYENTPLVIFSAQAAKTPVIASNVGGISEVIKHNKNGLLFKKGDVAELARAIQRILDEKDLLGKLSSQAKEPKSIETYIDELEKIYQSLVSEEL